MTEIEKALEELMGRVRLEGRGVRDWVPESKAALLAAITRREEEVRAEALAPILDHIKRREVALYDSDNKVSRAVKDELADIRDLIKEQP